MENPSINERFRGTPMTSETSLFALVVAHHVQQISLPRTKNPSEQRTSRETWWIYENIMISWDKGQTKHTEIFIFFHGLGKPSLFFVLNNIEL